jgi:hypothetical protein
MDNNEKCLVFRIDEDLHARFRIALRYDNLSQSAFIKYIVAGYLVNDKNIRNYIDNAISDRLSEKRKKNRKRDRKEENETIENFGLDEDEIKNIFDLIESENPDL